MIKEFSVFQQLITDLAAGTHPITGRYVSACVLKATAAADRFLQSAVAGSRSGVPGAGHFRLRSIVTIRQLTGQIKTLRPAFSNNPPQPSDRLGIYLCKILEIRLVRLDLFLSQPGWPAAAAFPQQTRHNSASAATPLSAGNNALLTRGEFVTSWCTDAVMDICLDSAAVFLNRRFREITGYHHCPGQAVLAWCYRRIYDADKTIVRRRVTASFRDNTRQWQMDFRFRTAEGVYRHWLTTVQALYRHQLPVRLLVLIQDTTERSEMRETITSLKAKRRKLINLAVISGQEEERSRISSELHDNVNQLLVSAGMYIGTVSKSRPDPDEYLSKAGQFIDMAVEEIRELARRLTPVSLLRDGLRDRVQDIATAMMVTKKIRLRTRLNDRLINMLSPPLQLMVYRIIQEQTNNIIKHSGARQAAVMLKQAGGRAELIISDQGRGFDLAARQSAGIGFTSIYNRVYASGGTVEINTSPGHGCTLKVVFPVTPLPL